MLKGLQYFNLVLVVTLLVLNGLLIISGGTPHWGVCMLGWVNVLFHILRDLINKK